MRNKLFQSHFQKPFSFILCLILASGSLLNVNAQAEIVAPVRPKAGNRDKSYAQLFRSGRGSDFEKLLTKSVGADETNNVQEWLDSNNAGFFRAIDAAFQNESNADLKQRRKRGRSSEPVIAPNKPAVIPVKRKPIGTRRAAFDRTENVFWQKASYNKTAEYLFVPGDEPPEITINKTVTDDGIQMDAAVENTKTIGDVTITQGASGDTRAIMVAGGNVGTEYKGIEYVEAVNNKERKSIRTETTVGWRSMTASCPDADGISAGTGTARIAIKTTITTPQTIGIVQREITVRMTLKGFVNDAAELTHFDMKGVAAEINSGYERARRLGLIQDSEFTDGTKQVDYEVGNNKLGSPVVNEYGFTRTVGEEMGEVKGTFRGDITQAEAQRIDKIAYRHIKWLCEQAAMYYKAARSNWRYGECVEIAFTAPKMKLAPAEKVDVTAETVHIYDKNKVNAELTLKAATDSATPEKESGTPKGKFNLTAPAKGSNAMIMLETVSRRGIALDSLDFEEEKPQKKPVPPKKKPRVKQCEGGWTGKITAVKSKRTETVKPASGRLVRQIENREETFSVDYYVLGIADTTQGFRNAYFSDAQMNYRAAEYRESNYAPGKMGCGDQIITTPQTQKFESLLTGLSGKRITVYVSSAGEKGILTFDSPEINAERIITRTYESSCPSYNAKNSSVDRSGALIGVPSPGFEIEFELDDKSGYVLEGSKTIENGDGSKTVVTWNLSRCK